MSSPPVRLTVDDGVTSPASDYYSRALVDVAFRAAYVANYQGSYDPLDALWWLARPLRRSPRGTEAPATHLQASRALIYRPGATDLDRERFETERRTVRLEEELTLQAAAASEVESPDVERNPRSPTVRQRRRSRRVLIAVTVVVAAVCIALVAGSRIAISPAPSPSASPSGVARTLSIDFIGTPAAIRAQRADLAGLFSSPQPYIGLFLSQHKTTLSVQPRSDSIGVNGKSTGPQRLSLAGIDGGTAGGGIATVLITCDRRAAYRWALIGPADSRGDTTLARGFGDCFGSVQSATLLVEPDRIPRELRVVLPRNVQVLTEVDLSR